MRRLMFVCLALTFAAPVARAQEDTGAMVDRLNRLERDINFLQKQVYRNSDSSSASDNGEITTAAPVNSGHLDVRMGQLEEQMRQMRGALEQSQFGVRQLATDMKKLSDDVDYRLRALEQKQATADAAAAAATTAAASAAATPAKAAAATATADGTTAPTVDTTSANTEYSAAFKLVSAKKYSEAAVAFDAFVKKYPSDPLTSNAYYWLGESYYSRTDYTRAAESFRKGFEVNPEAQKAPDNLLKLALSLNQVKRTSEACIVLAQIPAKYADSAPRTTKRAQTAFTELQCK